MVVKVQQNAELENNLSFRIYIYHTRIGRAKKALCVCIKHEVSHVMRIPVLAICEQQRRRSACASAQSDQHLCCSLLR